MNQHPYWLVATISVALLTAAGLGFLACATGWAWTKWRAAAEHRAWARSTRTDWDAEAQLLLAEGDQR
jgi:hypothetical protein